MQSMPPATHVEETLALEAFGARIPAALTRPAEGSPRAVILLVPGSLFLDVDGNMPAFGARPHAYLDLARQLGGRGYAVLRFAKLGPGTGSEVFDETAAIAHRRFATRVEVARIALDTLLARLAEPPAAVYAAGHSEGAVVATRLALRDRRITGLILLSGPSSGLFDIMREQLPIPPGSPPEAYAVFDAAVAAARGGEPLPDETATDPTTRGFVWMGEENIPYVAQIDAVNPAAELAKVALPALIVQGGADRSVRPYHAAVLAAAHHAGPTEVRRFPGLTHFYKRLEEGMDPADPAAFRLDGEGDPAVAEAIDGWIAATEGGP